MGNEVMKVIMRSVRVAIVAMEKKYVLHILNVCLYPWMSGMLVGLIVLSSVTCLDLRYSSTLSLQWHDLGK